MTIREASLEDLDNLLKLFVESIKATCSSDYNPAQIQAWTASVNDRKKWELKIQQQYFILAVLSSEIVGFASLREDDYLDMMYISHSYQGAGIAKKLLSHIIKMSKGSTISTHASLTARPFFERQGFHMIKENRFKLRGVEMSNYFMTLNN